ncbi:MAG TPA: kelch repeat-containing protein, partial [Chloroflexota bacterium]|nr:kelch repeat-containing protein [Chloroflexota bacterium]
MSRIPPVTTAPWPRAARRLAPVLLLLALFTAPFRYPAAGAETLHAPHWTQVVSAGVPPIARSQFGMAADAHGNIYILGGRAASSSPLADFWRFIAGSHTWEALPNLIVPPLVEPHLAVDAAGNVFEFGGVGTP